MENCNRCNKENFEPAVTNYPKVVYTICWDCLMDLDINHKNWKKYKKSA